MAKIRKNKDYLGREYTEVEITTDAEEVLSVAMDAFGRAGYSPLKFEGFLERGDTPDVSSHTNSASVVMTLGRKPYLLVAVPLREGHPELELARKQGVFQFAYEGDEEEDE